MARHYEEDAREAEQAAGAWAARTRAAVFGAGGGTSRFTQRALERGGADDMARSVWAVEQVLRDPRPRLAAEASKTAAVPYEQAYNEYKSAQTSYGALARRFGLRAGSDAGAAAQLMAYANQLRLQGQGGVADTYAQQSEALMAQAGRYKGLADEYGNTAGRFRRALPKIKSMESAARAYAAWVENPTGIMRPEQVYTYTVAPPLVAERSTGGPGDTSDPVDQATALGGPVQAAPAA